MPGACRPRRGQQQRLLPERRLAPDEPLQDVLLARSGLRLLGGGAAPGPPEVFHEGRGVGRVEGARVLASVQEVGRPLLAEVVRAAAVSLPSEVGGVRLSRALHQTEHAE